MAEKLPVVSWKDLVATEASWSVIRFTVKLSVWMASENVSCKSPLFMSMLHCIRLGGVWSSINVGITTAESKSLARMSSIKPTEMERPIFSVPAELIVLRSPCGITISMVLPSTVELSTVWSSSCTKTTPVSALMTDIADILMVVLMANSSKVNERRPELRSSVESMILGPDVSLIT